MRASTIVSGFASWRWTPCCALIAGSLLYVALVVLVVPNNLGQLPRTLPTPVVPQNGMVTSDALGSSASQRGSATHPLGTPHGVGLGRALGAAAAPPPRHLNESRAAVLGAPAMTPRPSPPMPPPAAAPPPPVEPKPAPPEEEPGPDEPTPPAAHPAVRSLVSGLHMVAPHMAPITAKGVQQPDNNDRDNGGSGNQEDQR